MRVKSLKFALCALGLTGAVVLSGAAQAVVMTWDYTIGSIFTAATYSGSGNTVPPATALCWGGACGTGSSLVIGTPNPVAGQVDTIGGGGVGPFIGADTSLTHNNNPIPAGNSLTSATLQNTVTLDPFVPNNPALAPQIINFNIQFVETSNGGTCSVSSSPTPCNDIFVLTSGLLNQSFNYDDGAGLLTYFVNIFPVTGGVLGVLENAACAEAGRANGCIGFTTPESQSTTLTFGFTISTAPLQVPEPNMLALLGIALLGMGVMRRKA